MKKIVKIVLFHCAKGTRGCEKCKTIVAEGEKYVLIDLEPRGGIAARPMMLIEDEGEQLWFEYDVIEVFKSEAEGYYYSKEHDIEILKR